jgi:hypothetical protein
MVATVGQGGGRLFGKRRVGVLKKVRIKRTLPCSFSITLMSTNTQNSDGDGANGCHREIKKNLARGFDNRYLVVTINPGLRQLCLWTIRGQSTEHAAARLMAGRPSDEEYQGTIHLSAENLKAIRYLLRIDPGDEASCVALVNV